ncbi:hypothetical protein DOZ80_23560 [Pseudomonas fluorescens]|uniref:Uncharacterized protein n=1 Tax=Pseudomonas fluorescens TaxID=294 RepID=A0A327MRC8_PSEFL|nr:hypothetical protein DOZ80_23560 [Pseudomonas fluorescens]
MPWSRTDLPAWSLSSPLPRPLLPEWPVPACPPPIPPPWPAPFPPPFPPPCPPPFPPPPPPPPSFAYAEPMIDRLSGSNGAAASIMAHDITATRLLFLKSMIASVGG